MSILFLLRQSLLNFTLFYNPVHLVNFSAGEHQIGGSESQENI